MFRVLLPVLVCLDAAAAAAAAAAARANTTAALNAFALDFWSWRSATAPITSDDLPRTAVVRPDRWPGKNVSAAGRRADEVQYEVFVARLRALRGGDPSFAAWSADDQTDYYCLTAALNRVYWELHVLRPAHTDPSFYLQQSFGAVWDTLVTTRPPKSPLWDEPTVHARLLPRLAAIPSIFADGIAALRGGDPRQPFATLFLQTIGVSSGSGVSRLVGALQASMRAVTQASNPPLSSSTAAALLEASSAAGTALTEFAAFVSHNQASWSKNASIGTANYLWFLRHVAFVNYTAAELTDIGEQQLARAEASLAAERIKNDANGVGPPPPVAPSLAAQVQDTARRSLQIRSFLSRTGLLRLPAWFDDGGHRNAGYTVTAIPPWLAPFDYSSLGEEDDFTAACEKGFDFVRYIPPPKDGLPFFLDSMARDARAVIVHEGIPGHWTQFRFAWRNRREARRHWLDSTVNEGWAYYWEETTLVGGLWDDSPRLRETMYAFMRLRAIRVKVDVGLATGAMDFAAAVAYFQTQVPMSQAEAEGEVLARLAAPAQGLSYVVGKIQLFAFQHAARLAQQKRDPSTPFDLGAFHAAAATNGNVPFVLQQHASGLATTLTPASFVNLHSRYGGVQDLQALASLAEDPSLVRGLPGTPPGSAPAILAGYADVGQQGSRSLFYLLVHADNDAAAPADADADADTALPLIIWLQGGNGCSSLIGGFSENGPFTSPPSGDPHTLGRNRHSLHRLGHVLYLDRPAGAGFSYSAGPPDVSWANDNQTALDARDALLQVLRRYPWLCGRRNVYVAGESYAGHFTVQLATAIADVSSSAGDDLCGVRLGGVMVGNGVVDINQTNFAWFEAGATHTLVEERVWDAMRVECDFTKDLGIDGNGCPRGVSDACAVLIDTWMNQSGAAAGALSLYDYYTDVCLGSSDADTCRNGGVDACADQHTAAYLNLPDVQRALHVRRSVWKGPWEACSQALNDAYSCPDTLVSVAPLYRGLLERGFRVLVYSGDVDGVVPTLASTRWIDGMGGSKTLRESWRRWEDADGQIGGWTMRWDVDPQDGEQHGELVFATVRGAGHQVPTFQARRAFTWFARFLTEERPL